MRATSSQVATETIVRRYSPIVLHLRVIAPEELRDPVIDVLRREVGVANVLLYPGAALEPPGDEITAVIARESANDVIKELIVQRVNAGLIREESTLTVTFLMFLTLACLIAAIGAVTDSTVTVVGAMVLGPEFGPLAALSVAVVQRRFDLARRALLALLIGFPIAMGITVAATLAGEAAGWLSLEQVKHVSEVDFIFQVGPVSFVVALLAGAAGMLSLVSSKSAALVGVFISVTTVPAAGFAVVAAVLGDWEVAAKSAAQLVVNLLGITVAGVLVLVLRPRGTLIPRSAQT